MQLDYTASVSTFHGFFAPFDFFLIDFVLILCLTNFDLCNNSLSPKPKSCVCVSRRHYKESNIMFPTDTFSQYHNFKKSRSLPLLRFLNFFTFFFSFDFLGKIVKVLFSFLEQLFLENSLLRLLAKNLTNRLIVIITPLVETVNLSRLVN